MAWSTLPISLYDVGKALKRQIVNTLKTNDDDHETRISALEAGSGAKVTVFNEIVELDRFRTGMVVYSFLTETQFQALHGPEWVLIDGSSVSGSDLASLYGSTLPDGRDRFPRILAASGKSIGDTEANKNASHRHDLEYNESTGAGSEVAAVVEFTSTSSDQSTNWVTASNSAYRTAAQGDTEARPDSLVLNAFTRKNDYELDKALIYRASFGFGLTSAIVTTLDVGTAGSLEIDLLKGSALGSTTTVFSTKPSISYTEGANASSTNAVFSTTSVSNQDWLQLDVSSLQTQQYRFHVQVLGELS